MGKKQNKMKTRILYILYNVSRKTILFSLPAHALLFPKGINPLWVDRLPFRGLRASSSASLRRPKDKRWKLTSLNSQARFSNLSIILITLFSLLLTSESSGQTVGFKGQLPIWTTINPEDPFQMQAGIRYIPELSLEKQFKNSNSFDAEISFNIYGSSLYTSIDSFNSDGKIKPYRIWAKYSTDQLEVRAGLQKINFGSAIILRPLMWFDQIDPKDPLQLTDGVYAILGRYYFMNNANIWLWGLIGNDELKGWESLPSVKDKPEFGGRVQFPFFTGEIAASYHNRTGEINVTAFETSSSKVEFKENRYALHLRIDKFIGFWIESAINHQNIESYAFTKFLNLGLDYTFNVGNGLGLTSEYIVFENSIKIFSPGPKMSLLATSLNYSINIISNISGMIYYDIVNKSLYRFVNTSWTFDKWSFYAIGFWNPDKFQIYSNLGEVNLYSGYGFQFMAVFNH